MDFIFGPVESLDKVPEQFRPLYEGQANKDGAFVPATQFGGVISAVIGLNKALKSERDLNKTRGDLSSLSEWGTSVTDIKTNVSAKIKELTDQVAQGGKINLDKMRQEMAQAHGVEIDKERKRAGSLQKQLYRLLVENAARAAAQDPAINGDAELLLPFVRQQVKVVEDNNGECQVLAVDEAGETRYSVASGQPLTIRELLASMKTDKRYQRLFNADSLDGGGMEPQSGQKPVKRPTQEPITSVGKISAGLSRRIKVHGSPTPRNGG